MTHVLEASERERTILNRFRAFPIPATVLRTFLEQNGWRPADVGDYGEVPEYARYFEEFATTVYLVIEPRFNDHHLDDQARRIEGVIFTRSRHVSNINRYRLEEVNGKLLQFILRILTELTQQSMPQHLPSTSIKIRPIAFVRRISPDENERDRSLITTLVFDAALAPALDGIDAWSHIYVIFWLHQIPTSESPNLHHPGHPAEGPPVGIFAARSPIHPNPLGLTLVELVKREENVLWIRGLDALDGTPVLDIKPYPDWEKGHLLVVTNFRIPKWLSEIITNGP